MVAVDLSPAMITRPRAAAEHADHVQFLCGDFLHLDLDGGCFVVLSSATLYHMPVASALARMRALVAPGGRIIVTTCGAAEDSSTSWEWRRSSVMKLPFVCSSVVFPVREFIRIGSALHCDLGSPGRLALRASSL